MQQGLPSACRSRVTRDRHGLSISLLPAPDGEVWRPYDVIEEKETEGVRREFVQRSTVVIDRKGVIRHAVYAVNPRHHLPRSTTWSTG